jgi:hypothetical protein
MAASRCSTAPPVAGPRRQRGRRGRGPRGGTRLPLPAPRAAAPGSRRGKRRSAGASRARARRWRSWCRCGWGRSGRAASWASPAPSVSPRRGPPPQVCARAAGGPQGLGAGCVQRTGGRGGHYQALPTATPPPMPPPCAHNMAKCCRHCQGRTAIIMRAAPRTVLAGISEETDGGGGLPGPRKVLPGAQMPNEGSPPQRAKGQPRSPPGGKGGRSPAVEAQVRGGACVCVERACVRACVDGAGRLCPPAFIRGACFLCASLPQVQAHERPIPWHLILHPTPEPCCECVQGRGTPAKSAVKLEGAVREGNPATQRPAEQRAEEAGGSPGAAKKKRAAQDGLKPGAPVSGGAARVCIARSW